MHGHRAFLATPAIAAAAVLGILAAGCGGARVPIEKAAISWRTLSCGGLEPRGMAVSALDSHRNRILLYGGIGASGESLGDLWEFRISDLSWRRIATGSQLSESAGPGPRHGMGGAIHLPRSDLFIFSGGASRMSVGGKVLREIRKDAWAYPLWRKATDAGAWEILAPTHEWELGILPRGKFCANAFLDSAGGRFVLVGGGMDRGNAWTRDPEPSVWTLPMRPAPWWTRTPARGDVPDLVGAAGALDVSRRRYLLFGGARPPAEQGGNAEFSSDVYSLRLFTLGWTRLSTSGAQPPPAIGAQAFLIPSCDAIVLLGGACLDSEGKLAPQKRIFAFLLGENRWTDITPSGAPDNPPWCSAFGTGQYDPSSGRIFLFGGLRLKPGASYPFEPPEHAEPTGETVVIEGFPGADRSEAR